MESELLAYYLTFFLLVHIKQFSTPLLCSRPRFPAFTSQSFSSDGFDIEEIFHTCFSYLGSKTLETKYSHLSNRTFPLVTGSASIISMKGKIKNFHCFPKQREAAGSRSVIVYFCFSCGQFGLRIRSDECLATGGRSTFSQADEYQSNSLTPQFSLHLSFFCLSRIMRPRMPSNAPRFLLMPRIS